MRVERFFRAPLFAPLSKYAASYVRACVGRNQSDRLSGTRETDRRIRPRFRPTCERASTVFSVNVPGFVEYGRISTAVFRGADCAHPLRVRTPT